MDKINWGKMLVEGIEWFARLAILNLCWLFFSLPLLTFIPASAAGYEVLKLWKDGEALNHSVLPLFKEEFITHFKESYRLGLPFLIVGLILSFNLFFFFTARYESSGFLILKYATVFLAILYVILFSYSFALVTFFNADTFTLIKMSFVIMFSQPLRLVTLFLYLVLAMSIFMFFPALFFFFSFSVLAYQFLKVTEDGYSKLLLAQENK